MDGRKRISLEECIKILEAEKVKYDSFTSFFYKEYGKMPILPGWGLWIIKEELVETLKDKRRECKFEAISE